MKKVKKNYFKYLSLFFAMIVLVLVAGCSGTTPTTGAIEVNSTPDGARVYLDGVDTGQVTPIILPLVETGNHSIKLDKFHYEIWEDTAVTVNANQTTYLNPPLTYASTQTITLQPGPEGKDSYTSTAMPNSNTYSTLISLYVGTYNVSDYYRSYLQFDLSTIPADAMLEDADLRLYQYLSEGSGNFQIGLHRVTSNWKENIITHNLRPTSSSEIEALSTVYTGSTTWRNWDIDNLVQGWLNGSITNQGMVLKSTDETLSAIGIYFRSSDYTTDTTKCPKLVINYYIP